MKAIPPEMRQRIVAVYHRDKPTYEALGERFQISGSCAWRIVQRYREDGQFTPRPKSGRPLIYTQSDRDAVREFVITHPDSTLSEIREFVTGRSGKRPSLSTLHLLVNALNLTLKKKRSQLPSRTAPMSVSRGTRGVSIRKKSTEQD